LEEAAWTNLWKNFNGLIRRIKGMMDHLLDARFFE